MGKWLQQTGIGLTAWSLAGISAWCIRVSDLDHWWMFLVAFIPAVGFWACLDWYAAIKRGEG